MRTSTECAVFCDENKIILDYCRLPKNGSLSFEDQNGLYIVMDDGEMTEAQKKIHLAHELGHCMTGAFYRAYSPLETRSRCEHKANVWMINRLLPKAELEKAFSQGITESWELADYFDVTEELVKMAYDHYYS